MVRGTFFGMSVRRLICCCVVLLAAGVAGCAKAPREAQGMLDTPLHHYETGMRLLDDGQADAALRSFNTALELDADYGPAIAGKGLVLASKGDVSESLELIRSGQRKASRSSDSPERMWTLVAEQRAFIVLHEQGKVSDSALLRESRRAFNDARIADEQAAMPWYWEGVAYLRALEFDEARSLFREAQVRDQGYGELASARLELLEKIIKASLKTSVGKRIALVDEVSRADMSALLIEELGIEKFFEGTEMPDTSSFVTPQDAAAGAAADAVEAVDIQNHPLVADIKMILPYRMRGLQPYADHTFQPNKPITRAELALILEDIYIRAKNDTSLATRFMGQESPFPDVRGDHPYFNSVMFVTTRGLLTADVAKGLFKPLDTVSGVDAVLLINAMKTELDVF
ncbi:S-layer homology domain-containing protein [Desulfovibrio mangrovi]|uniref:tetratricopeptide repeat protein n=1 Tax=Desulfovibrio mangrovi TaxID=2976983 RepID=UPI0022461AE8|nr:S-layer homology domain-containing protein [Desulfovibrio mangrovi]UZP68572.1 S-layer homology domain-containing protein [Desulfovibrio mangrovi]